MAKKYSTSYRRIAGHFHNPYPSHSVLAVAFLVKFVNLSIPPQVIEFLVQFHLAPRSVEVDRSIEIAPSPGALDPKNGNVSLRNHGNSR